jgi:pimeloyl-ACP methyl ester carboxylesterase
MASGASGIVRAVDVLRTPEERFTALPDFPYQPRYVDIGLRVHYVDEGPRGAEPVLLMHGEPTWSYLWRHVMPGLLEHGHRVIAIDLVGFGRSDKPARAATTPTHGMSRGCAMPSQPSTSMASRWSATTGAA